MIKCVATIMKKWKCWAMAVYNPSSKWLYLMEPHTASRATSKLLRNQCNGVGLGDHHISLQQLYTSPYRYLRNTRDKHRITNILVTLRNPFDILITKWKFGPMRHGSFRDFVFALQNHTWVKDPQKGLYLEANNFVYYEFLEEDLRRVFGNPNLKLEVVGRTDNKKPWQSYYENEDEMVELLTEKFREHMTRFGYILEYNGSIDCTVDPNTHSRLCVPLR